MKKTFSKIFKIIGIIFFVLCFCASDIEAPVKAVSLLTAFFVVGIIFCIIGIKLSNPKPQKPQRTNKKENNINYSKEFEKLYNKILLIKVCKIINEGSVLIEE